MLKPTPLLEVRDLHAWYGESHVLHGMTFSVRKGEVLLEQRGVVIETGPLVGVTEGQPRAVPGERVLIAAYSGYAMKGPADGKLYRIVNERDIFAVIHSDAPEVS